MFVKDIQCFRRLTAGLGSIALAVALTAAEVTVDLVSKARDPRPTSGGDSGAIQLSADGRWAVFISSGNGLATNDQNGLNLDVFLRDLQSGQTTLVSRAPNGESGNGHSWMALLSANGRYVVFESEADNLVAEDENEGADIFIYDHQQGSIEMLTQGELGGFTGNSSLLAISPDARFILFETDADDFVQNDNNDASDFFLLDRQTREVELITANYQGAATAESRFGFEPWIGNADIVMSASANLVAFISPATNLVADLSTNLVQEAQLYLWDRASGTNRLISPTTNHTSRTGSSSPTLNSTGEWLAFISEEVLTQRLYLYHISSQTFEEIRVSDTANTTYQQPHFDADGKQLVFAANDQIWLRDIQARFNRLVSASADGSPGSATSDSPLISADGQIIIYSSHATNLTADVTNDSFQLYSFRPATGETRLLSHRAGVSADNSVLFPALSMDGSKAGFVSHAYNLEDHNRSFADLFVVNTSGSADLALVSTPHPSEISATANGPSIMGNSALSADGRYVAFSSAASDLVTNDTNNTSDLFLRDLWTGETKLIGRGLSRGPGMPPELGGMSRNGRTVVISASIVIGNMNHPRTYAYDIPSDSLRVVSVNRDGQEVDGQSPSITDDGRYVAFLGTTPRASYVRDLQTGTTTHYDIPPSLSNVRIRISPTGRYILAYNFGTTTAVALLERDKGTFQSLPAQTTFGSPFSADDSTVILSRSANTPAASYTFVLNPSLGTSNVIATGRVDFASVNADGSVALLSWRTGTSTGEALLLDLRANTTNFIRFDGNPVMLRGSPDLTPDGRYVALVITNETTPSQHMFSDVFVYDRILTNFTLVSRAPNGEQANGPARSPSISADGRVVVFDSSASNLVPNDRNFASDIFVARISPRDSNNNGLDDGWELTHFGGLGLADPSADSDGDGLTNLQEFLAGTNPHDLISSLRLQTATDRPPGTITIVWPETVIGKTYQLQHRASLTAGEWRDIGNPQTAVNTWGLIFDDATTSPSGFYRLRVRSE